ncbi:UNVERIFIED_CONTAM: B-box zinc finger protein 22 [Sesamum angustifolium]|uniref:B-box zinc finger protein 22 n=1 Tax=Sesamum angustifolium TaxID=2727405 RepID=A0AAW2KXN5_9LAMI
MKIQCNVCEAAEANVLCCADEAALCWSCDQKVHAANKLASKHQRVPLSTSSSQMPKCDICQETVGYFFCLEDRALLCRKCDVAIHTANSLVSGHQRFCSPELKWVLKLLKQADSGKLGGSEDSQNLIAADGELEVDECMGQVPDTFWAVPQIPSPPTASGLYWPKNYQNLSDSTAFVPDLLSRACLAAARSCRRWPNDVNYSHEVRLWGTSCCIRTAKMLPVDMLMTLAASLVS